MSKGTGINWNPERSTLAPMVERSRLRAVILVAIVGSLVLVMGISMVILLAPFARSSRPPVVQQVKPTELQSGDLGVLSSLSSTGSMQITGDLRIDGCLWLPGSKDTAGEVVIGNDGICHLTFGSAWLHPHCYTDVDAIRALDSTRLELFGAPGAHVRYTCLSDEGTFKVHEATESTPTMTSR